MLSEYRRNVFQLVSSSKTFDLNIQLNIIALTIYSYRGFLLVSELGSFT